MITKRRWDNFKRTCFAIEVGIGRTGGKRPLSGSFRHEANLPGMVAIVKFLDEDFYVARYEFALQADISKWIFVLAR